MNITFTKTHWLILIASLASAFAQLAGLKDWHAALTPTFVGATGLAVLTTLKAIFTDAPAPKP